MNSETANKSGSISAATPVPQHARNAPVETHEAPTELTAVVDELLESLNSKFANVSAEIFGKIEAMGKRLDAMEASLQQQQQTATTGK